MACYSCQQGQRGQHACVGGGGSVLARVVWMACSRGKRASVVGVMAWVMCQCVQRGWGGWLACVDDVLAWVACYCDWHVVAIVIVIIKILS